MRIKPFVLFSFIFQTTEAKPDEVCGQVTLTYFLRSDRTAAKLEFVPNTKLKSYRWVYFVQVTDGTPEPNFDFQDSLRLNSSKYEKQNFSIIIKDLQASDHGMYNIECETLNGDHLFSGWLNITEPYTLPTTPILSTAVDLPNRASYVSPFSAPAEGFTINSSTGTNFGNTETTVNHEEAKSDPDSTLAEKNDNSNKTETDVIAVKEDVKTAYEEHTTQLDAALTGTVENETAGINVTAEGFTINSSIGSNFGNTETTVYYQEAKSDPDSTLAAENDNSNKTETDAIAVKEDMKTTYEEHTTQLDAALTGTVENETAGINVTGIMNATSEETKSVQEEKWLNIKTLLLVGISCTVCAALVILAAVTVAKTRLRSKEEDNNEMTSRYDLTTLTEQTGVVGNLYRVTVAAEMKTEMQTFSDPKSSTQDLCSTFVNASNVNERSELQEQTAQIEYYDNTN